MPKLTWSNHTWPAAWIALLFVLCGLPFLSLPGMHVDAASELTCFYSCSGPAFRPVVLGFPLPIMVLPYLGAFKGWLYQPLLASLDVTSFILRLPLLLVAAASVWMFFVLLDCTIGDRTLGRGAAIAGAVLLATDTSFVICSAIDFGPVVFLHFFFLAGVLLLLRFEQTRSPRLLALAFFLFGLGLWHKALFVWMLGGLAAAALAVFPHRLRKVFTARRLGLAVISLCLGAAPLLLYNLASRGATLRTQDVMTASSPLRLKVLALKKTLDGSAMMGFLTEKPGYPGIVRSPSSLPARLSVRLSAAIGPLQSNWMLNGMLVSFCLLPWLWFTPARHAALFAAVYLAAAWAQMLVLPNTGSAAHHALLLWPFPHFLMVVAGSQLARKIGRYGAGVFVAVVLLMAGGNILLLNQYVADLATRGPGTVFTDAIYPLHDYLAGMGRRHFGAVDWGFGETLCLLSDGDMDVEDISIPLRRGSAADDIRAMIAKPRTVFVGRVQADEQFPGVHAQLNGIAAEMGYDRQVVQVIEDRNGRARFEVLRYIPRTESASR